MPNQNISSTISTRMNKLVHWLRFNWLYFGTPPWDTGVSPPELLAFIEQHPPGWAIDLGCGTGTNLLTLAQAGWKVTGVEFVPRAAKTARHKLNQAGVQAEVRTGDVAQREVVQGSYDLVLDIGCYHGLPASSRARYRENVAQILKPAGYFLLYAHWQPADQQSQLGITHEDFSAFQEKLTLETRTDSQDRWDRRATWMLFIKL
jgi:SAM-dependent methyltransferase